MNWDLVSTILKGNKFERQLFLPPVKIAISLLKSIDFLSDISKMGLNDKFSNMVTDIWLSDPDTPKDNAKKENVIGRLSKALNFVYENRKILANDFHGGTTRASYQVLVPKMQRLDSNFTSKTKIIESTWMANSNPFVSRQG
jgi:hypothetical protein